MRIVYFICLWILLLPSYASSWDKFSTDGFGDPANIRISSFAGFSSTIFCGTFHRTKGAELRYLSPGLTWEPASSPGFGDRFNREISSLLSSGSYLYGGTMNLNLPEGGKIYRSADPIGLSWDPVVGETATVLAGFGDPANREISAMIEYAGFIFAGVTVNTGVIGAACSVYKTFVLSGTDWNIVPGSESGFGDNTNKGIASMCVFNAELYAGTYKLAGGAELWRYNGSTWTYVTGADGFGDAGNTAITALTVYKGNLIAGTRNEASGAEVWKSSDGTTWVQANDDGFGRGDKIKKAGSFISTPTFLLAGSTYDIEGGIIWVSADAEPGSWYQSSIPGFGNVKNTDIPAMYAFDGFYYAGTANTETGASIWRSNNPASFLLPLLTSRYAVLFLLSALAFCMIKKFGI